MRPRIPKLHALLEVGSKHCAGVSPQPTGEASKADQHDLLARAGGPGRLVGVRNELAVVEGGNAGVRAAGPGETTPG